MSVSSSCSSISSQSTQHLKNDKDLSEKLKNIVNEKDLQAIIKSQNEMLQKLEKSNQMLENCNNICETHQGNILEKFRKHTAMLVEMKQDLNVIFSRIRKIKEINNKKPEVWLVIEPQTKENTLNNETNNKQDDANLLPTSQTSVGNDQTPGNLIDFREI